MGHILIMIGCFCKACKSGRLQSTPAAFILACEKSKDCKNPCFFAALNDNNYRKYLQTWIIRNPRQNKLSSMCWCVLRKIAFYLFYLWGAPFWSWFVAFAIVANQVVWSSWSIYSRLLVKTTKNWEKSKECKNNTRLLRPTMHKGFNPGGEFNQMCPFTIEWNFPHKGRVKSGREKE